MRKIGIDNPSINTARDYFRRYSAITSFDGDHWLVEAVKSEGITPDNHPKAIELFAGDGPLAWYLSSLGWKDITCVDMEESPDPMVPEANWKFMDLASLAHAALRGEMIEPAIERLRHAFDLVVVFSGGDASSSVEQMASEFFKKPDGKILHRGVWEDK